jgi:RNase P subunit RPR2
MSWCPICQEVLHVASLSDSRGRIHSSFSVCPSCGWDSRYRVDGYPERKCDQCGTPYSGPAVFCSLACAVAVD